MNKSSLSPRSAQLQPGISPRSFPAPATKSAPRVLKILQCSNLGGMEQTTYDLLRDLKNRHSFRFRIVTPRPFGKGETFLRFIDPSSEDSEYKGRFGWRSLPRFRRRIRQLAENADHVWLTGTCACSLAAIRPLSQPTVLGHHFHHFDGKTAPLKWFGFYHAFCRDLHAITYPTDFTRNEALQIAPWLRRKTHVVRYGYRISYENESARLRDQLDARRELGLPEDAFIVGNAGWLIARKRFDLFLETAHRIKNRLPNAFFVICGGGPLEEKLREQTRQLGLEKAIRFTGWVDDVTPHYRAWDLCLFNSDFDALGRTPMEAASHGCLVAASVRYGGLGEYLKHGENGIFLSEHDPETLSREIVSLAQNPKRANEMREAAAAKLRAKYSPDQALRFYDSIFC